MRLIIVTFFTLLCSFQALATVAKAFSFSSKLQESEKPYACTATLIKIQGQCHLLTNNHCVENKKDFKIDHLEKYSPVGLIKVSRRLDLAILSFNSKDLQLECRNLEEISLAEYETAVSPELVKVFAVTGFVNNRAITKFTSGVSWETGFGASQVFYKYMLGSCLYFWHASNIDIVPGMSGSPVISNRGAFLGLATKYVDFQSSALLIPTPMILGALKDEIEDLPEMELGNFIDNSFYDSGNEHGGAGNEHGGAGNEHGGAGGEANPVDLSSFRAPNEGVLVDNRIILGFISRNGFFTKDIYHQIDGREDYQIKLTELGYLPGKKHGKLISRPIDGYPELQIRNKILERMDGYYYLESENDLVAKPFNQNYVTYQFNPKKSRGTEELERRTSVLMVDVNSKKNSLTIEGQGLKINFKVSYSSDFKQVLLSRDNVTLVCENRQLLKLICHNEDIEFSLSVSSSLPSRVLKYRLSYKDNFKDGPGISYWFGAISASDEPDEWRKK
jgi:hypothetical protein